MHRASFIPTIETLQRRAQLLAEVRRFFDDELFIEVDTPALAPSILPEPSIDVFTVSDDVTDPAPDSRRRERYLLPSPERWMKRLVAAGAPRIYQLSHSFRRGEPESGIHSSEFMMLEWYAIESDYTGELERTKRLIRAVAPDIGAPAELTVAEAVRRYAGIDLEECRSVGEFRRALEARAISFDASDTWADLFHRLIVGFVEPAISSNPATALIDYPEQVHCLARRKPGTSRRERWELYLGGVEVANCYTEESDADELERLFRHEREAMGQRSERIDTDFVRVASGITPPYSGVALGFDRLMMAVHDYRTIDEVALLPDTGT
jgi:elongation factor P--(R)-beta-lysine ligase